MVGGRYHQDGIILNEKPGEEFLKRHMGRRKGNSVLLNVVEALYAMEMGWIDGIKMDSKILDFPGYMKVISKRRPGNVNIYIVYRDLRRRGHVALWSGGKHIEVLEGKASATVKWVVLPHSFKERVPLKKVFKELRRCIFRKRKLLLAFYDTEGDVTYYKVTPLRWKDYRRGKKTVQGEVVHFKDLAVVLQRDESGIRGRWKIQFMDRDEDLFISGLKGEWGDLTHLYGYLTERGYIVKSGLKYGAHFRIYKGEPERSHSKYLLRYQGGKRPSISVLDLLATARISHGVRKELILGIKNYEKCDEEDPYLFLSIKWARI